MGRILLGAGVLVLAAALVLPVGARTVMPSKRIVGTARADVLKGTPVADIIDGRAGNDKLYGKAGNDVLIGGAGNDLLIGGPGKDRYACGPGQDTVVADASDVKPGSDCEKVIGLPKPSISIADASGTEGNSGTTALNFEVTLSASSSQPVSVAWATADGTATAGSDYQETSAKLVFAPAQTSKTVSVAVIGDTAVEPDESFTVTLSEPVNATIADGSATGTIKNDDTAPPPAAHPGHFGGFISSGGSVNFDVRPDGNSFSNLAIVFDANCQPDGMLQGAGPITFSGVVPIQSDKTFSANGEGSGFTVSLSGTFDVAGTSVSGSVHVHTGFDYQGTHYECDTGNSSWSAKWQG